MIRFSGVYNNKLKDISNRLTDVFIRAYAEKKTKSSLYSGEFLIVKKKAEGIKIQLKNNGILEEKQQKCFNLKLTLFKLFDDKR